MASHPLRLRRALSLSYSLLERSFHGCRPQPFSPISASRLLPTSAPAATTQLMQRTFTSSTTLQCRKPFDPATDEIGADTILFEGCDYKHWLITVDFPRDANIQREQMIETYVNIAAQVFGSVEEAKKKIYALSTTTYQGFQVECSEAMSEKFKSIPQVVFVLPDSYIDPGKKEYGGDKYVNGEIFPRPPPVHYRTNTRDRRPRENYGPPPQQIEPPPQQNNRPSLQQSLRAPPQQNYGKPPQHNYGPPPQQNFGPSPQQNYGPPPQQNFGPSPQQNYGSPSYQNYASPQQQSHKAPQPHLSYGSTPPQSFTPSTPGSHRISSNIPPRPNHIAAGSGERSGYDIAGRPERNAAPPFQGSFNPVELERKHQSNERFGRRGYMQDADYGSQQAGTVAPFQGNLNPVELERKYQSNERLGRRGYMQDADYGYPQDGALAPFQGKFNPLELERKHQSNEQLGQRGYIQDVDYRSPQAGATASYPGHFTPVELERKHQSSERLGRRGFEQDTDYRSLQGGSVPPYQGSFNPVELEREHLSNEQLKQRGYEIDDFDCGSPQDGNFGQVSGGYRNF